MIPFWVFFYLFSNQTFWIAIGSIGTIVVAYTALKPISEKARIGKAIYEQATQIDIGRNGIFRIINIFDEPVIIKSISQCLQRSSQIKGLVVSFAEEAKKSKQYVLNPKNQVSILSNKKGVAPKASFILANSLTHLPEGYEQELSWFVGTTLVYTDSLGNNERKINLVHRYSILNEPRLEWVEML